MKARWIQCLLASLCFINCAWAQSLVPDLEPVVRRFEADQSTVQRAFDMRWSAITSDRLTQLHRGWLESIEGTNFNALAQQARIDHILLRNELVSRLNRTELQRERMKEMDELLSFRGIVEELERARWQMRQTDAQAAATKVAAIPDQVKQIRERIEKGRESRKGERGTKDQGEGQKKSDTNAPAAAPLKVSPAVARRAANAVGDIRGTLKSWFEFYNGFQPDFSWWLKKPYDEANSALESYGKFLREEIADLKGKDEDPLIGDAIGRDALIKDIASEFLPYSPEELIAIGEREFAWCEAEMKKAAKELGHEDWMKALARVKSAFVPPGQQDDFVAQVAQESTEFVKSRDLVTVSPLCEEVWRLTMLSPDTQKSIPYVAYGGGSILVAYAKDEMKHEDKLMSMRGNNRHFTRITTAHELIPGHHLQAFNAARNRSYRSTFSTPFFVEGWALYWEMRLWDLGFGKTPEDRIGMLFWRMHRAARIIVSLKFHLGQMQPKEMVDFLVNRVGHERFGATSEVRRYIAGDYSPLYQSAYMIGGLQLRALHQELVASKKISEREFHDTVLTFGPIPVEMIRAGMMDLPLQPDHKSTWRFGGR